MTRPTRIRGGWEVRLRVGKGERERFKLPDLDEPTANDRAARMERMRNLLIGAGKREDALKLLHEAAKVAADDGLFDEAELIAQQIVGGSAQPAPLSPRTFRDVCDIWTSGELNKRYPHRVAAKQPQTIAKDKARLERICETIGSIPIGRVTEADCDRAIAALPSLAESTRAKYAQLLAYVLRLAVSPMKLTKASPLPEDWVPGSGERAEFQMLYPDEERQLMLCEHLSLEQKYFWGFLAREGISLQEAFDLTWGEVDLVKGTVRVVRSKTGRPRRWRMGDDVVRALTAKKPKGAGTSDLVFTPDVARHRAAEAFRLDLSQCGIDRQELHESTPVRRRIRAHDLRGTFVALSLARGRSDQWIMDRTGHTQSQMLRVYDRDSRFAADAKLGWFGPLDVLLGVGQKVADDQEKGLDSPWPSESSADFSGEATLQSSNNPAAEREPSEPVEASGHRGAPGGRGVGPSGKSTTLGAEGRSSSASAEHQASVPSAPAAIDPLAQAIADLALTIRLAAEAGQWPLVARLTGQLEALKVARAGVTSIDAARRRKNGDEP